MPDIELYKRITGLEKPWNVKNVELDVVYGHMDIWIEHEEGISLAGPTSDLPPLR